MDPLSPGWPPPDGWNNLRDIRTLAFFPDLSIISSIRTSQPMASTPSGRSFSPGMVDDKLGLSREVLEK
jgi:hypothetical protein